jgi:hypothetical protein
MHLPGFATRDARTRIHLAPRSDRSLGHKIDGMARRATVANDNWSSPVFVYP